MEFKLEAEKALKKIMPVDTERALLISNLGKGGRRVQNMMF